MLSIFGIIYIRIDTVMLSIMKGDEVVGWYNAAYNLVLGLKPIPALFLSAIFPLMAGYFVYSMTSLKMAYEKASKFLLIIGLPLAVGVTLLAHRFIPFLYGDQFNPSIIVLQILAWDLLLIFLYGPLGNVLVSINKQNQMATVAGMSAFLNIILNLILIPPLSYVGAAIATIITEVTLFMVYLYLVSKHLHTFFMHKIIMRPAIASLAMGFFIYLFTSLNFILVIILSVIIYFIILYSIGGISHEDIDLFRQVFKRSKGKKR
jgi:O-antigen/teichoic acid export membrane protein